MKAVRHGEDHFERGQAVLNLLELAPQGCAWRTFSAPCGRTRSSGAFQMCTAERSGVTKERSRRGERSTGTNARKFSRRATHARTTMSGRP